MDPHAKSVLDTGAILTAIGSVIGWLPALAALLSIIWTAIRIVETRTVQRLIAWWLK